MAVPFSRPEYCPSSRARRRPQRATEPRSTPQASADRLASHFATRGRRSSLPLGVSLDSLSLTSRITFYALYEAWRLLQEVTRSLSSPRLNLPLQFAREESPSTLPEPKKNSSYTSSDLSPPPEKKSCDESVDGPHLPNSSSDSSMWTDIAAQIYEVSSSFEISYNGLCKASEEEELDSSQRALFESYLALKQSLMKSDLKKSKSLALSNGPPLIIFLSYSKTALRQLLLSTLWFLLKKVL